jgi:hypothetical protein
MKPNFIYRPSPESDPIAKNATLGVRFAQRTVVLDPWYFALFGKNKWERTLFRLRHPIIYSKRGILSLYRRIKRIFVIERSKKLGKNENLL